MIPATICTPKTPDTKPWATLSTCHCSTNKTETKRRHSDDQRKEESQRYSLNRNRGDSSSSNRGMHGVCNLCKLKKPFTRFVNIYTSNLMPAFLHVMRHFRSRAFQHLCKLTGVPGINNRIEFSRR